MQDNSLDIKIRDENKIIPPRPPQPDVGINYVSARYQYNSKDVHETATKDIVKVCKEEADFKGTSTANNQDSRICNEENTKFVNLKSFNVPQKLNNNHAITASPSLLDGLKQKISKKIEETALNYQHNHPDSGLGNALLDHLTHSTPKPQTPLMAHTHMVQLQESNSVGHTHRRSSILSNHLSGAGFKYENKVAPLPPSSSANNLQDIVPTNDKLPKFSAMYNKLEDKVKTNSHVNNDNNKSNKENQDDFERVAKSKSELTKPKKGLVTTLRTLREHGSSSSTTLTNKTTVIPKVDPIFSSTHSLQEIISPGSLNAISDETSTSSSDINIAREALPDSEAKATNNQTPASSSIIPHTNIWGFCNSCIFPHGINLPRPVSVACAQIIAILRHGTPLQHCSNQSSHSALSIFILFTILSSIITLLLAIHYSTHSGYTKLIYLFFNFIAILTRAYHSGFIFFSAGFATAIATIYFYDYTFGTCIKEIQPSKTPSGPVVKYTEDFETITQDGTIPSQKLREDLPAPVQIKDENNDNGKVNDVNALGTATINTLPQNLECSRAKMAQPPKVPPSPNYRNKHPFRVDTYQGWINELTVAYDFETYRVQQTRSVYVTLEGRFLKMSIPKNKVSKRSVWDEKPIDISTLAFTDHRYYDLSESLVYLQPQDLPKKVYWSKKYPISIKLFHKTPLQRKPMDDGSVPLPPSLPPKQPVSIGVSAHYPNLKTGPSSPFKTNYSSVASDIGAKLKGKIGKTNNSTLNSGFVGVKGGSESLKDYMLPITDRDEIQMREVKSSLGVGGESVGSKSRSPSPIDKHAKDDLVSKKGVRFSKETKFELKEAKIDDGCKEEAIQNEERKKVKEPEVLLSDVYLHLFTRTNRDKEEWFWRFLRASQGAGSTSQSSVKRWLNPCGGSFATTLDPRSSTAVWTSAGGGLDGEPDCGSVFVAKHNAASTMDKPDGIYFDADLYTNIQDLRLYLTPAIFDELLTPDGLASDVAETRFMFANKGDKDCYTSSTSTTSMPNAELGSKKDNSAASNGEKLKKNPHKNLNSDHQTTAPFKENRGQNRGILTYALVRELNPLRIHPELCWLNAFIQRLAWDFFKHKFMAQNIVNKLKRKLNKVKLPYFVEPLSLLDLDFGSILPSGRLATRPWTNERGIWTEIVISFTGTVSLTLSTKVNLMKLKAGNPECMEVSGEHLALPHSPHRRRKHVTQPRIKIDSGHGAEPGPSLDRSDSEQDIPLLEEECGSSKLDGEDIVVQGEEAMPYLNQSFNLCPPPSSHLTKRRRTWASRGSESEDSPESSDEEGEMSDNSAKGVSVKSSGKEVGTSTNQHSAINSSNPPPSPNMGHQSTGKKILKMVDKIANSKYFQQAAEMKYIKRGMEAVSNTPIVLTVELTHFEGIMALNIPEPPSDRLWYGFRPKPEMKLASKPKLGAKHVNITQVTDWIEKTLLSEFEKLLVIPNMDDVIVPIMMSGQIYPPLSQTP